MVFRTLDDLMASKKRKMLEGSIAEDEGAIEYSKDDMTQYSKAVGIVNKKRVKGKKKGKKGKKGNKKKLQARIPGAVHYDVDAEKVETADGIENTEGSLEGSVDLSQEEEEEASPHGDG